MKKVTSLHSEDELGSFLDYMYGDETGYAYSPTKGETFEQYFFQWPTERAELLQHIRRHTSSRDVYYSPGLFERPSATKDSFRGSRVLWAEFDGSLPESLGEIPQPSLRLKSSTDGHEHWYWRLNQFETNQIALETITQRLTYHLGADLACWNANRVLRPPGTVHHDSGLTTSVIRWSHQEVSLPDFINLPELPEKALTLSEHLGSIPMPIEVIAKHIFSKDELTFFLEPTIEQGSRSSALTKLAHICMEKDGLSNAEAMSLLLNADGRWKKFHGRNDQRDRLLGIINYCRSRHPVDPVEEEVSSRFRVYTYDEFINTEIKLEWVVPNLLHKKGVAAISGPPAVGKSQFSIRFAEALAKGEKFLQWEPVEPTKTLFVSMEMPHEELLFFIEKMEMGDNELLRDNMLILPLGHSLKMNNKVAQAELNAVLERYQPTGVIFDSLGKGIGKDIASEEAMLEAFEYVDRIIRAEFNAFAWFVHHPRKGQVGNKKPNTLDDLYGSQYFGANITTATCLWPEHNNIEVTCLKLRLAKQFDPFIVKRTPNLNFAIMDSGPTGPGPDFSSVAEI